MIYFLQRGQDGPIKIGFTSKDDVSQRMATLQTACPERLTLIGMIEGGLDREKALHRLFSNHKLGGEWFDSTPRIFIYLLGLILGRKLGDSDDKMETSGKQKSNDIDGLNGELSLPQFLASQEQRIILATVRRNGGNVTKSAKDLGVTFRALRYAIKKYSLNHENKRSDERY
jgi:DNA-binding NtrC family response regulator